MPRVAVIGAGVVGLACGITLAPATASLLAPLVLEGHAASELQGFDPARMM